MKVKILSPFWGHEHLDVITFLDKIREAGYDGVETSLPADADERRLLLDYLQKHEMCIVTHERQAEAYDFKSFKDAYKRRLQDCATGNPILINSHTGRDYYSVEQNLELIDIAQELTQKTGIAIAHETHRGRIGYVPYVIKDYFEARQSFAITADFSHWVCVSESYLENFSDSLMEAVKRTLHVHARVGYPEGPQVPDPRAPEWSEAVNHRLEWWDRIVDHASSQNKKVLTFTTEFGPPPYLHTMPFTNKPVANQFEINCYMKDLLNERYLHYRS